MSYLLFNGLAKKKNTFTVASDHEYKEIDSINIVQSSHLLWVTLYIVVFFVNFSFQVLIGFIWRSVPFCPL